MSAILYQQYLQPTDNVVNSTVQHNCKNEDKLLSNGIV